MAEDTAAPQPAETTAAPTPTTPAITPDLIDTLLASAQNLRFDTMERVLLDLLPDAGEPVVWKDFNGNDYKSPDRLPLNRQIQVGITIRKHMDVIVPILRTAAGAPGSIAGKLALAADPAVGVALGDVFRVAHPTAVPEGTDPGDVFPGEEMIKAITPFSVRVALELLRLWWPAISRLLAALAKPDPSTSPKT